MKNSNVSLYTNTRIAKAIAHSGLCSRRDAEKWIAQGRVSINGKCLDTPAYIIKENDKITVDGEPLAQPQNIRLWRYHKPKGLVTTHKDPEGRTTVFEALAANRDMPRVISIGRLDINTEGLLLLTTNGDLARTIELPETGWLRRYRVRANGRVSQQQLDKLAKGITVEGVRYGPIQAELEKQQGANNWIKMGLREGKNREIKKVLAALGLQVNRLIRTSYGPFVLGEMKVSECKEISQKALSEQLGHKLSQKLGLIPPPKK